MSGQLSLFNKYNEKDITEDIFQAYFDARRNKRNTINALAFERHFEANLFKLENEILNGTCKPSKSICFIVNKPVKREIFAADFRDRVVHHFIYKHISPIFEKTFINDSYSCRKGKGTHYGIKRIDHFIRSCSKNYSEDCYILKLDIKGYFMSMNRNLLFEKVKTVLSAKRHKIDFDLSLILFLLKKTIFNDPTKNCSVKGKKSDWDDLPKTKSLFHAAPDCGLPIGNLTSQLFGNIYLNDFDHFVKRDLNIKHYGRYVDDFILLHPDKKYLTSIIPTLSNFLLSTLKLTLHPDKIYLQHFTKGVKYLGAVIKPHRIYIANRTRGNFYEAIKKQNAIVHAHKPSLNEQAQFLSSMNSFLGIMKHYKTHRFRKNIILKYISAWWWNYVYLSGGIQKFVLKRKSVL
jgi:RNA-directed DNA polymerase